MASVFTKQITSWIKNHSRILGNKTKYEVKYQQLPFPTDTYFEQTLFMATTFIGVELEKIEKSYVLFINYWVGWLMQIIAQTCYDIQYIKMHLSGYMNEPSEPAFPDIKHGMEYLMHLPHEPIMYSIKKCI